MEADIPQLLELYSELQPLDPPIDYNAAIVVWEQAVNSGVMYFVADNNARNERLKSDFELRNIRCHCPSSEVVSLNCSSSDLI